ncbi:alpha/beta fold hydrolase [Novosphingobium sp. M1R2S20]|uniref:Alpha/beta fold hydrolase n=1 Tax=Novosphingobium rhizovicinum TaxID=3228928 RepID=A0ABV3RDJ6_9SPHN
MSDLLATGWNSRHVRIGDVRLHVVEAGPEDGSPIILLHGFPEFWWAWRLQIDRLANAGLRVIAPDMRGYNLSDAPSGVHAYAMRKLVGDVTGLASALGYESFALAGHDWGGLVAWHVASRHPSRVTRLAILDATHPDVWRRFALRHPTQALRSAYVAWFQLPLVPEAMLSAFDFSALRGTMKASARNGVFPRDVMDRYAEAWRRAGALTAMLNYYRALSLPGESAAGKIRCPTAIIWGESDSFLDNRLAHESAAMCDNASMTLVPESTHWLHLEQPANIAAQLIALVHEDPCN